MKRFAWLFGFAFQNILQNFIAGLLLLWTEPFRVGDEIKIDPYEGRVEDIQARAIIRTYDERRFVVPNADLFTRSVVVNTAGRSDVEAVTASEAIEPREDSSGGRQGRKPGRL